VDIRYDESNQLADGKSAAANDIVAWIESDPAGNCDSVLNSCIGYHQELHEHWQNYLSKVHFDEEAH